MLIIIDAVGKVIQNHGTNSAFPDGDIPGLPELEEGQKYIKVHDESEEAKQIMDAHEYTLNVSDDNLAVNVIKTKEQWKAEKPISVEESPLDMLAKRVAILEAKLGIGG